MNRCSKALASHRSSPRMKTMSLFVSLVAPFVVAHFTVAAEPRVQRDVPYVQPASERNMLDLVAPADGKDHPIAFWIHGGGWQRGDKSDVQAKPQALVDKGFVFVSTNYRFVPQVT